MGEEEKERARYQESSSFCIDIHLVARGYCRAFAYQSALMQLQDILLGNPAQTDRGVGREVSEFPK